MLCAVGLQVGAFIGEPGQASCSAQICIHLVSCQGSGVMVDAARMQAGLVGNLGQT